MTTATALVEAVETEMDKLNMNDRAVLMSITKRNGFDSIDGFKSNLREMWVSGYTLTFMSDAPSLQTPTLQPLSKAMRELGSTLQGASSAY